MEKSMSRTGVQRTNKKIGMCRSDSIMFEDFLKKLKEYASNTLHIESIIVVGSYARGTNKEISDFRYCYRHIKYDCKSRFHSKIWGGL